MGPDRLPSIAATLPIVRVPELRFVVAAVPGDEDPGDIAKDRAVVLHASPDGTGRLESVVSKLASGDGVEIGRLRQDGTPRRDELVVVAVERGSRVHVALHE